MCFVELILLTKKKAINPNKVTNEHKKILSLFYLDYGNLCSRELAENDWVLELDDHRRERREAGLEMEAAHLALY